MAHRGIGLIFMCQLLGMNSNVPTDIMFSFSGFAQRACEHADGFGIAFFEGRGVRCFVDAQAANASPVAGNERPALVLFTANAAIQENAVRPAIAPMTGSLLVGKDKNLWSEKSGQKWWIAPRTETPEF